MAGRRAGRLWNTSAPGPLNLRRYTVLRRFFVFGALALAVPTAAAAQGAALSRQVQAFVSVDEPVVALINARVIDGTGGPTREGQTVVIRDGTIVELGATGEVSVPGGAEVIDLDGRTLLPGYVMLHEHLFYPVGGRHYNEQVVSFPRLYLAGGATTIRTAGSMNAYADLNLKRAIDAGQVPGPEVHVTGPYLNGPGLPILGVKALEGPEDARRMVEYWAGEGVTSFKAYMQISRAELGAAIEEAHARGLKVTGHLCSVTYREAADLGIDDLEHGFFAATDFVAEKEADRCPPGEQRTASLLELDVDGPEAKALIDHLVSRGVAVTSTMPVFETYTPGRPPAWNDVLDAMLPETRDQYLRTYSRIASRPDSPWTELFAKGMQLEYAFAQAGGLLVVGTDPTGYGGVVAGFSNQRVVELLVEGGFTIEEAISIATLNGARYLEIEDRVGSIEVGKQADLIVISGDPRERSNAVRNVELVFKNGIGYDSAKLVESVRGLVGLR
jgi:enamidase